MYSDAKGLNTSVLLGILITMPKSNNNQVSAVEQNETRKQTKEVYKCLYSSQGASFDTVLEYCQELDQFSNYGQVAVFVMEGFAKFETIHVSLIEGQKLVTIIKTLRLHNTVNKRIIQEFSDLKDILPKDGEIVSVTLHGIIES